MAISLDKALGIYPQAVKLRAQRAELIARNLANADTPGFKARDIDFKEAMKAFISTPSMQLKQTANQHMSMSANSIPSNVKYRTPLQPSLDGNTVSTQIEISKFSENAVRYQASIQFLNGSIRSVLTALKGE